MIAVCRAIEKVPSFKLHAIGRHGDKAGGSFWRDYTLSVDDLMYCHIREMFPAGVFNSSSDDRQLDPCPTGTIWVAVD
jgi:hypothetical protein